MALTLSIFVLFILINFLDARIPLATDECQALIDTKIDPEICCMLPQIHYNPENEEKCREECSTRRKRKNCCIRKCRVERLGIYVNETFNKEALKEIFMSKEIWGKEIEKAVENCAGKFSTRAFETQISCIPSFVQFIYFCTNAELFITCPQMSVSDDCEELKGRTEECLKSDPTFQFPAYYYKWKFNVRKGKVEEESDNKINDKE